MEHGSLHMILGPMFSGKSTRLIEHIRAYKTLDYPMMVIKPDIDQRYTKENVICTHNKDTETCFMIAMDQLETVFDMREFQKARVIMIEEAQFFTNLYKCVHRMLDNYGMQIYLTALNGDSKRELFGEVHLLLPLCHDMEWLKALCIRCKDGTPAVYSKRTSNDDQQIVVAGKDQYEAVCQKHYFNA